MPSAVGSALKSRSPLRKQCASKVVRTFTFSFSMDSAALPQVVMCWAVFAFSPPSRLIYRVLIWAPRVRCIRQYEDIIPVVQIGRFSIHIPIVFQVPSKCGTSYGPVLQFANFMPLYKDMPTYIVPLLVVFKRLYLPALPQR